MPLLINAGADVNVKNSYGETPLHSAAWWDSKKIVPLLINAGADINAKNNDEKTALNIAREKGFTEIEALSREATSKKNVAQLSNLDYALRELAQTH